MKRRTKCCLVAAIALSIVAGLGVHHFRPLIRTSKFSVEASGGLDGRVYRMLGRPDTLFIELRNDAEDIERWFTADIASNEVATPNHPKRIPYLHFNHDMSLGVSITDHKYGEGWQISGTETGITFSHAKGLCVIVWKNEG